MIPQPILIDTDIGDDVDDVLALAFALLRPELAVKAITTVSFCTPTRAQLVARLLKIMGRSDVAFAPGMNLPLRHISPAEMAKLTDLSGYKLNHAPFIKAGEPLPAGEDDAIALMKRVVDENAGEIILVGIGPLTNIATFLRRHPDCVLKIRAIALMGGELELNRREHNVGYDAIASEIVFSSGVPIFLGTWNVTRGFVLSPEDCARIKELHTPLGDALGECIDLWWPHKGWKPGPVMYDVAPLIWSFERRFYPTEKCAVQIDTGGGAAHGFTVRGGDASIEVSISMLADEVRALWLDTICDS